MGRSPCCEKVGLKKGPWTPEEDQKLLAYIEEHGHGSWRALPAKAGLQRCGKSCRLRWTNYLRPDIKRGKFSLQEEQTIIQLHALLGNRWSAIATHLPKRTDNEIKNYWNTHLKKRLTKMGIDPVTHKPKSDALGSGQSKDAANLSHMAQWESARLEAEARLGRDSKPSVVSNPYQSQLGLSSSSSSAAQLLHKAATAPPPPPPPPKMPPCLDVLKAWQGAWTKPMKDITFSNSLFTSNGNLESPTSTLNFSENIFSIPPGGFVGNSSIGGINYAKNLDSISVSVSVSSLGTGHGDAFPRNDAENDWKYLGNHSKGTPGDMYTKNDVENDWKFLGNQSNLVEIKATMQQLHPDMPYPIDATYIADTLRLPVFMENYSTDHHLLQENIGDGHNMDNTSEQVDNVDGSSCGGDNFEENKNYWNNILNLVTLQSGSSVF